MSLKATPAGKSPHILACVRQLPNNSEGERVVSHLNEAGCDVTRFDEGSINFEGYDAVMLLGNLVWYPAMVRDLRALRGSQRPIVAVWHWEPLPPPRTSGLPRPRLSLRDIAKFVLRDPRANDAYTNSRWLRKMSESGLIDILFTSTPSRVEYLAEHGMDAGYAPLGYDPEHGQDFRRPRDLDVLFLGDLRVGRRRRVLSKLRRQGVPVEACGDWFRPEFWGDDRTKLLNRAKIFLNIHRFPGEFSGLRMILGMANGSLVISEPMYRPEPFLEGRHYISARVEEMPSVINHYLQHEDDRARIARQGMNFVMNQLRLETSVQRILAAIKERIDK